MRRRGGVKTHLAYQLLAQVQFRTSANFSPLLFAATFSSVRWVGGAACWEVTAGWRTCPGAEKLLSCGNLQLQSLC